MPSSCKDCYQQKVQPATNLIVDIYIERRGGINSLAS